MLSGPTSPCGQLGACSAYPSVRESTTVKIYLYTKRMPLMGQTTSGGSGIVQTNTGWKEAIHKRKEARHLMRKGGT